MDSISNKNKHHVSVALPRIDVLLFESNDLEEAKLIFQSVKTQCADLYPWPLIIRTKDVENNERFEVSVMTKKGGKPDETDLIRYRNAVSNIMEKLTAPNHTKSDNN